jgi:hypothetical protein
VASTAISLQDGNNHDGVPVGVNPSIQAAARLQQLEEVIRYGLQTFVEVGNALKEISEQKLYREQGYATFEEYCKKRWRLSRKVAYDRIVAADVVKNISDGLSLQSDKLPSATQAVELAVLEPEQQREVAGRIDFSSTTVKELKQEVRRTKRDSERRDCLLGAMKVLEAQIPSKERQLRISLDERDIEQSLTSDNVERILFNVISGCRSLTHDGPMCIQEIDDTWSAEQRALLLDVLTESIEHVNRFLKELETHVASELTAGAAQWQ